MKNNILKISAMLAIVTILTTACSTTVAVAPKKLPPGQAKKIAGTQSAKPFAPGQQKKKH